MHKAKLILKRYSVCYTVGKPEADSTGQWREVRGVIFERKSIDNYESW